MSDNGCIHLNNYKAARGVQPYRAIYSFFVACTTPEARQTKWRYCSCYICNSVGPRLHSCFHCIFFGCYKGHIQEHARSKNHYLAIDLLYGNVLCFQCGDYIYDEDLRKIAKEYKDKASTTLGISSTYKSKWDATRNEVDVLKRNPRRRQLALNTTVGLRGLFNLGNTCFMNCVIQVLVHTPVLRDYFLAEQHACQFPEQNLCLVCEVSDVIQQFYCGDKEPLTLLKLLHIIWSNEKQFVGIQQHDAHEFFIVMLNILHTHCKASVEHPLVDNRSLCQSIIDQIFTGGLQSDIVCQSCKCVSTTVEPFRALSLDIGKSNCDDDVNSGSSNRTPSENSESNTSSNGCPILLLDCLEQYTRTEHLGSMKDEKIKCINCKAYQESTKQTTIQTLPVIACFHLKRFKHLKNELCQKISTVIGFPAELDMTPFLTNHRNGNNKLSENCCRGHVLLDDNRYSLFAVVNHQGSFDGGHYIAFVRQQCGQWFKCDDHKITRVNLHDVLNSEGYLLFYHKQVLEYE